MTDGELDDRHRPGVISSRDNRRIKSLRRLAAGRGRPGEARKAARLLGSDRGARELPVLLEGPHLLDAALEAGIEVTTVVATEAFVETGHPVLAKLGPGISLADAELLESMADADSPRGLLAVGWTGAGSRASEEVAGEGPCLYLDRIADPGNLGAILRAAEAAGSTLVALSPGSVSWRHPRTLRASAGSALRLALHEDVGIDDLDRLLAPTHRCRGRLRWAGLAAEGDDLYAAAPDQPSVLALGAEAHGLSPEVRQRCDRLVALPMSSAVESLNVAVATGIALYEWRRRRESVRSASARSPGAS